MPCSDGLRRLLGRRRRAAGRFPRRRRDQRPLGPRRDLPRGRRSTRCWRRGAARGRTRSAARSRRTSRASRSPARPSTCRSRSPTTSTSSRRSSTRRTSGRLFRPDAEPLQPNWRWLPVAYHGRAGTVVVSGTDVVRPRGEVMPPGADAPMYEPSSRLDVELELGFVVGMPSRHGHPVPVERLRRPRLRRRARQRLERARHAGVGVPAARPVPRQVVPDLDLRLGDAARAARGAPGRGASAGAAAAAAPRGRPRLGARPRPRDRAERRRRLPRERADALLDDAAAARARDRRTAPRSAPAT